MLLDYVRDKAKKERHPERAIFDDCPVYRIQNVSDYYFLDNPKEKWPIIENFPIQLLPYEKVWFEYRLPQYANINGQKVKKGNERHMHVGAIAKMTRAKRVQDTTCADAKWIVTYSTYMHTKKRGLIVSGVAMAVFLNDMGLVIPNDQGHQSVILFDMRLENSREMIGKELPQLVHPMMLAANLINCKNVEIVEVTPKKHTGKVSKRKQISQATTKYNTIIVTPTSKRYVSDGNTNGKAMPKALHIVPGQMRDYRENGLFGKHKGIYWFSPHTRGRASQGEVIKDYEVRRS